MRLSIPAILVATFSLPAPAQEPAKEAAKAAFDKSLIVTQAGDLPIILSAPHGGRKAIPDCPERKGDGVNKFVVVRDDGTMELAELLAVEVEKKFGKKPSLVVAKFERKYCDVNRPAAGAYESDIAKPYYDAYHEALSDAGKAVQKDFGRGLLIDIHGQAADAAAIYRGTQNLKTTKTLIDRFGTEALVGPKSLLGVLAKQEAKILPSNDSKDKEDPRFSGGYIVGTYGSHTAYAIDAIQLEFGMNFRKRDGRAKTARDLAEAIHAFAAEFLPAEKKK
jgi:N-formylglutamate amidohydrolase